MEIININDESEFKYIYNTYSNMIYRISLIYLSDTKESEDVVQETFIKLFNSKEIFTSSDHVKAWLITVCKNLCKDSLKSFWRSRRVDIEKINEIVYEHGDDFSDSYDKYALEELLKLPSKYKIVLYLFYFEEYFVKDISKVLDIKESTIQTQLLRGRKMLEKNIKERLNEQGFYK